MRLARGFPVVPSEKPVEWVSNGVWNPQFADPTSKSALDSSDTNQILVVFVALTQVIDKFA